MEIPEALQPLLTRETNAGARRLYDHGMQMFVAGERRVNGGNLIIAAIGDAPALYFSVLQRATEYLTQQEPALCTQLLVVARDGLLKAVEAECEHLNRKATGAVGGRHVLDLSVVSGTKYTEATTTAHALNNAAAAYIGQLETLIRNSTLNATTNK